jgi:hypothetical protein
MNLRGAEIGQYSNGLQSWTAKFDFQQRQSFTRFDNKVPELATMCLPWQQWTETSVCVDDDTSAFHSCVIDLWPLFLSGVCYCLSVFWCAVARMLGLDLEL